MSRTDWKVTDHFFIKTTPWTNPSIPLFAPHRKAVEASNGRFNKSDAQIRRTQVKQAYGKKTRKGWHCLLGLFIIKSAAIKKRFLDTIQRYQDIERSYQQKYRQRVERQIRIGNEASFRRQWWMTRSTDPLPCLLK
jgi:hypothetical protein